MVYTNLQAVKANLHGMFESSRMRATEVGHLYDALVKDEDGNEIEIDNGVAVRIGDFTGNGLQEVNATVAKVTDKIAVTGAPANIKDAFTTQQKQAYNYVNIAGNPVKTYEVVEEDIFAVASYQFTDASTANVKVGSYVVLDGNGSYVAQTTEPDATTHGFVGKIHSITTGTFYTMVRILVLQNKDVA